MKVRIIVKQYAIGFIGSLFLFCSSAAAAPAINSISGTVSNSSTVQLNGSFGSMGGEIVSWDNFEAHRSGVELSTGTLKPIIGPTWTTFKLAPSTDPVVINSNRAHSGTNSVLVDWGSSSINSFGWSGRGPFDRLYITYWRYQEGSFITSSCNHKQFYLYGNRGQFPQNMPLIPAGSTTWGYYNNVGDSSVSYNLRNNLNTKGWGYTNTANKFQRWEFFTQLNTPYTSSNGIVKMWLDGQLGAENYAYRHRTVDGEFVDFRLGHMAQGFTSSARAWFDDLYISTTQARVELGDNPVFNNCTHREIQVPNSWANGDLSITVNSGSFSAGQTAYLFVVDASGQASPGYRVTIGSSASGGGSTPTPTPPPPATPTNLRVVSK